MKRFLIISSLFCLTINAQNGTIIPLSSDEDNYSAGVYKKDLNNEFAPYIGKWECNWQGKIFTLTIDKAEKQLVKFALKDGQFYRDELFGMYTLTENTGGINQNVIVNTMATTFENSKFKSVSDPYNNQVHFLYYDKDNCGISGEIYLISDPFNPNVLKYYYFPSDFWKRRECQYTVKSYVPIYVPHGFTGFIQLNRI